MNKVSIILPIYNSEKYLRECLESIMQQTFSNFEVLMINDGSTDASESICKEFVEKDKRFFLYSQKNSGVSVSRNTGLNNATGRYILFVDSDDICEKDMLEIMLENFQEEGLVVFSYNVINKKGKTKIIESNSITTKDDLIFSMCSNNNIGGFLWNKLFDYEIIKKFNIKFDNNIYFYEDFLFIMNYLRYIQKIVYVNKSLYNYRLRKNSLSSKNFNINQLSIFEAYSKILYLINNEQSKDRIKIRYLKSYYLYKNKLSENNFSINYQIISEEKNILKKISKKEKLKFYLNKYFYFINILFNKLKSKSYFS